MAADKFLRNVDGVVTEISGATTAVANAIPALDGTGRVVVAQMPVGVGPEVLTIATSETLVAGNFVNIWKNGAALAVRKADASAVGKEANGFVLAGFTHPTNATVYVLGGVSNTAATVTTLGARQYLSTTPGATAETMPTYAGGARICQLLGKGITLTEMTAEAHDYIVLAS